MLSDCCGTVVIWNDICSRCREHCDFQQDSDDGYDAAKDAYLMGYGEPVTYRQRQELKDEMDSRRYGW